MPKKEEIKFPFEPSEKVKAAFRHEGQMKVAIRIMTEALVTAAAEQCSNPFELLREEHPDIFLSRRTLFYDQATQTIDIRTQKD